jgi:hypothetical protein
MHWAEIAERSILPRLHAREGSRVIELVDEAIHSTDMAGIVQDDITDGLACALVL